MGVKTQKVNAFEAKTNLSQLLRETERGESFIICRRGKEVARLIPVDQEEKRVSIKQILSSFHEIRKKIRGKVSVRELIEEGRRF